MKISKEVLEEMGFKYQKSNDAYYGQFHGVPFTVFPMNGGKWEFFGYVITEVEELLAFAWLERKKSGTADRSKGDPRFYAILDEMAVLHAKKSHDYGAAENPLANVMSAIDFGIPNWVGVAMRMNDKVIRVKNMARTGKLENESIDDAFIDVACYAILALLAYREGVKK